MPKMLLKQTWDDASLCVPIRGGTAELEAFRLQVLASRFGFVLEKSDDRSLGKSTRARCPRDRIIPPRYRLAA